MDTSQDVAPRVYVGTYAKYNSGSIAGAWVELDGLSEDEFYEKCAELHKDEAEPEFMFQDFEGFPEAFYGESGLSDELWGWLELSEDDRELLAVYADLVGSHYATIDAARDAFMGVYDDEASWAEDFLRDSGQLSECPELLAQYFDYEAYARDCRLGGDVSFVEHRGQTWVFSNH